MLNSSVDPPSAYLGRIFFDGTCGLCHRTVKFLLAREKTRKFRFAPLQGTTFQELCRTQQVDNAPDSLVVQTTSGQILFRSEATLFILTSLGGFWRTVAAFSRIVPRPIRNVVYDFIARIRYRLFRRPDQLCPIMPADLRERFDP